MAEKTIINVLTIEDWARLDPAMRKVLLDNIKLKDRLSKWLMQRNSLQHKISSEEGRWVPCHKCEKKGWLWEEPRRPGIHPSQLGQSCMLKIYNEMIGKAGVQNITPRTQLIFDIGHAVHHMFQTYGLKGAWGPEYKPEAPISADWQDMAEELMLEGHADAENVILIDDIPGSPYAYRLGIVHEYKTANSNNFGKLTGPKPEHKKQAIIYAAALNRPVVVYLYLNKDDSNLVDFPVAFDQVAWQSTEAKIRTLLDYFKKQTPPPGEVGFYCKDCAYVYDCPTYAAKNGKKGA